ncbi:MAG: hypothetical protein K0S65_6025 [Labilithrix sp.]|nr:hypothetical protein [Labilithrix sp.]
MKLSLSHARGGALLFGIIALGAGAACADAQADGAGPSPDAGDPPATLPDGGAADDGGGADATPPTKDAEVEGGPKACSDHGFCLTVLPANETVKALWGDGAGILWAATEQGDVLRWNGSPNGGAWSVHTSGLGQLTSIWGSSPTDIWVGGNDGIQHGTGETSATVTFTSVTLPGEFLPPVQKIWGPSANDLWAVASYGFGDAGFVFHYDGSAWALDDAATNTTVGFTHVWGGNGTVWLGGSRLSTVTWQNEVVLVYKPAGEDFKEVTLPVNPDPNIQDYRKYTPLVGAVISSSTSLTLLGQPQGTFETPSMWQGTSSDGGKTFTFTWAPDPRADRPTLFAVAGKSGSDLWAAGAFGRLIHWNGTKWSTTAISLDENPTLDPFYAIWSGGPDDLWVAGKNLARRFDPAQVKSGGAK